ncbi:MAG: cation:proton antiporter, partial [Oscillospiraceae bacterium]|nr:cation:proton antiporter [Oscillospiraceae bacterium]
METILIQLSFSMVGGLLMSRLAKLLNLPAVTAYLVAGLLLGPYCLGALQLTPLGFTTAESVASLDIISQVALGFIAFTIGNEFRLEQLKSMGKQAITVGILQAVITTALVDVALVALHFINPDFISISSAITLGAIAAATGLGLAEMIACGVTCIADM